MKNVWNVWERKIFKGKRKIIMNLVGVMLRFDMVCKIYLSIGIDINEVGLFLIDERKIW